MTYKTQTLNILTTHILISLLPGHYYAFGKDIETQKWYKYSDALVELVEQAYVLSFGREIVMLMYASE